MYPEIVLLEKSHGTSGGSGPASHFIAPGATADYNNIIVLHLGSMSSA